MVFWQRLFKIIVFYSYSEISPSSMSGPVAGEGQPAMEDRGHSERRDQYQWGPMYFEMCAKQIYFIVFWRHKHLFTDLPAFFKIPQPHETCKKRMFSLRFLVAPVVVVALAVVLILLGLWWLSAHVAKPA